MNVCDRIVGLAVASVTADHEVLGSIPRLNEVLLGFIYGIF